MSLEHDLVNALSGVQRQLDEAAEILDKQQAVVGKCIDALALTTETPPPVSTPGEPEPEPPPTTEPDPKPEPTEPPPVETRPPPTTEPEPTEPPPTETRPEPSALSASWDITLKGGNRFRSSASTAGDTLEAKIGPLQLVVIWDKFAEAMAPTPTVFLKNPYRGSGVVRWEKGTITVGRWAIDLGPKGAMPPRYAVVQSQLTAEHWALIPETEALPAFWRARCLHEAETHQAWIGPYRFAQTDRDQSAPGGDRIGLYGGGTRSWKSGSTEGRVWLWTQAIDAASRGIWMLHDDGSGWTPGVDGKRYWWDASATEYARDYGTPGWGWLPDLSGWCSYEGYLANEGITDTSHAPRRDAAIFALAHLGVKAAKHMAREIALECMRMWSMDQRVPATGGGMGSDTQGYSPLWELLEQQGMHSLDRRAFHIVRGFAEASRCKVISQEEAAIYLPAVVKLMQKADNGRGLWDHGCGGDAGLATVQPGTPMAGKCPASMFFQASFGIEALRWISEEMTSRRIDAALARAAETMAEKAANWWGALPPYTAHTGGTYASATVAPHVTEPIGHDYAMYTKAGTWKGLNGANYGSFVGVVAASRDRIEKQGGSLRELQIDCIPEEHRVWTGTH